MQHGVVFAAARAARRHATTRVAASLASLIAVAATVIGLAVAATVIGLLGAAPAAPAGATAATAATAAAPLALAAPAHLRASGAQPASELSNQPVTWNATQIHVAAAQAPGRDGQGVVVAVVDGFVDATHPDFRDTAAGGSGSSRVLDGADCRTGSCLAGLASPDACGHGTHVAGTVASSTYGIAPKALILPVTVLAQDSSGTCSGSPDAVAAGIRWAAVNGAKIINLSLGDGTGPALLQGTTVTSAISFAAQDGVLVIAAAGNNGNDTGAPNYGADALVVAATKRDGELASYSNRGSQVELAAPGGDAGDGSCNPQDCVASTWLDHGYALLSGTSMAAPAVSGTAALMLGADPELGRVALMRALTRTAHPLDDIENGLLDTTSAVHSVEVSTTPSTVEPNTAAATPSRLVVPPSEPPVVTEAQATRSAGGTARIRGPWQLALLLVIAVGTASATVLLRRVD